MVQQVFGVTIYKSKTNNNCILYKKQYINILCIIINKNQINKVKKLKASNIIWPT